MKIRTKLVILVVLVLCLSACGDNGRSESSVHDDIICYEDFPGVPDLGALLGYEQYTKTRYEDLTLYSYKASFQGSDGTGRFKDCVDRFAEASEALGNTPDTRVWEGDNLTGRVSCGDQTVYISYVTGEHNGEVLSLLIAAVGAPENFEAYAE